VEIKYPNRNEGGMLRQFNCKLNGLMLSYLEMLLWELMLFVASKEQIDGTGCSVQAYCSGVGR
jgi:hypothetical protein